MTNGSAPTGIRAVSLIVASDADRRILLVRSSKRAERWELPGGQIEHGESPMDAARRELEEETGVAVDRLRLVGLYYGAADALLRITFAGVVDFPAVRTLPHYAEDIVEARWFSINALPSPMPVIARQMVHDSITQIVELRTVTDDSQLA